MKKGRVSDVTRPEPTIYGNCDSWASIVGKKGIGLGLVTGKSQTLQAHNGNLYTTYQQIKSVGSGVNNSSEKRPETSLNSKTITHILSRTYAIRR